MARAATPAPPEFSLVDELASVLLAKAGYGYVWHVALACYVIGVCLLVRASDAKMNPYKGLAVATIVAFGGGGTIPALLLGGRPSVIVATEWAVPSAVAAWLLTGSASREKMLRSPAARAVISTGFEILRFYVSIAGAAAAHATLTPSPYYPVCVVGPLVCGWLGGCGGVFSAAFFGTGAAFALENGPTWPIRVSAVFSVWLQLTTRDPTLAPYVAAVGLADPARAQALGIFVLAVLLPLLGMARGFEPLGPSLTKLLEAKPAGKPKNA